MEKLRVGWGIKVRRYEEKVKKRGRNIETMLERERIWMEGWMGKKKVFTTIGIDGE